MGFRVCLIGLFNRSNSRVYCVNQYPTPYSAPLFSAAKTLPYTVNAMSEQHKPHQQEKTSQTLQLLQGMRCRKGGKWAKNSQKDNCRFSNGLACRLQCCCREHSTQKSWMQIIWLFLSCISLVENIQKDAKPQKLAFTCLGMATAL